MADIFNYGYDKSLQRGLKDTSVAYDVTNPTQAQNIRFGTLGAGANESNVQLDPNQGLWLGAQKFNDAPFSVDMLGNVVAHSLQIGGGTEITVSPGDDIQAALNAISVSGGGTLRLAPGTYHLSATINIPSNIIILGTSSEDTFLDFGGGAYGLNVAGSNIYTTGTITSIAGGIVVTGSGTSWLANAHAGQYMFLGTRWYQIAAVTADNQIYLAEPYSDDLTMPGLAYRIATCGVGNWIYKITLQNSTGTLLNMQDNRYWWLQDLKFVQGNKGLVATNTSNFTIDDVYSVVNVSNGIEITNASLGRMNGMPSFGNGGHGFALNNLFETVVGGSSSKANTGDGWNLTNAKGLVFSAFDGSSNGGCGMQMVSGCTRCFVNSAEFKSNTLDGIKLTATDDSNVIGPITSTDNAGYGINIADSTCDTNQLASVSLINNTLGNINNAGTGTKAPNSVVTIAYSANQQAAADTERSTNSDTFIKIKEFKCEYNGTITASFDLKSDHATTAAHGRLYINGSATGADWFNNTTTYATKTDTNKAVAVGDLVQLYAYSAGGTTYSSFVRNFRLYFDVSESFGIIVNTD
jgi:hypothetical protein